MPDSDSAISFFMLTCSCYNCDSIGTLAPHSANPAKVIKRFCCGWYRLQGWTLARRTTIEHCDENIKLFQFRSTSPYLQEVCLCDCPSTPPARPPPFHGVHLETKPHHGPHRTLWSKLLVKREGCEKHIIGFFHPETHRHFVFGLKIQSVPISEVYK